MKRLRRQDWGKGIFQVVTWLVLALLVVPPLHLLAPEGGCPASAVPVGSSSLALSPDWPSEGSGCRHHDDPAVDVAKAHRLHSPLDCPLCLELLNVFATSVPVVTANSGLADVSLGIDDLTDRPPASRGVAPWAPRAPPSFLG